MVGAQRGRVDQNRVGVALDLILFAVFIEEVFCYFVGLSLSIRYILFGDDLFFIEVDVEHDFFAGDIRVVW